MVETWVVHQKINWGIYQKLPAFYTMEMLNEVLLDPSIMQQGYVFLRENGVESEEAEFQFGQNDEYNFYDIGRIN